MHTFEKHGLTIFHNNDLRSTTDVHLQKERGAGFTAPQQALVAFVAQLVTSARISELEQAEPLEVFGFREAELPGDLVAAIEEAIEALFRTTGTEATARKLKAALQRAEAKQ
jgi:hypothetical protein